jgi:elongation factor P--(R)-beta-lysine ligase
MLERRAALLAHIRRFFAARAVLEVDTPVLVNHPVSDVHIHSARVTFVEDKVRFLHSSPEYAMKRLLASGSGDIYQICHVVRAFERSRLHNPEFTLLEWYRIGYSLAGLMAEVETLLRETCPAVTDGVTELLTYRDAFVRALSLDPFSASMQELEQAAATLGFTRADARDRDSVSRDDLLDFMMAAHVGANLGHQGLVFVHAYPASQAALARLNPADARAADRFELYCDGVELANGYHELASHEEQRARFENDNAERRRRGLPVFPIDERLLAALATGLPDCAGVALGIDRLLMLATAAAHIDEVIAFPTGRA